MSKFAWKKCRPKKENIHQFMINNNFATQILQIMKKLKKSYDEAHVMI